MPVALIDAGGHRIKTVGMANQTSTSRLPVPRELRHHPGVRTTVEVHSNLVWGSTKNPHCLYSSGDLAQSQEVSLTVKP
uniref:Uncharacterized protein n=1 Tax=Romanomermis culicivorax TaxID=13658 RepID=A0A915KSU5_ROMCU